MKRLLTLLAIWVVCFSAYAQNPKKGSLNDTTNLSQVTLNPVCKHIIGYYPSWQMYDRGGLVVPATIDYEKYTMINYAFFQPDSLGNLTGTDFWADSILLRGKIDWGVSTNDYYYYFPNTSLVDYCHAWGVRCVPSIGGWTLSEEFPKIAADSVKRHHFAAECMRIIRTYQFDGIDIDWEYPGYEPHKGTPEDKKNFTLFMKAIRDSLDALGAKMNYKLVLTAAFGANKINIENIEWDKISEIMDYINLMTYDYNGTWSPDANHHTALMEPTGGWGGSVDRSFKMLVDDNGVPPSKINIGAGFYGRSLLMKGDTANYIYGKSHYGLNDMYTFREDEGSPQYYNIIKHMKKFDKKWDDAAQAPYLTMKEGLSVQLKGPSLKWTRGERYFEGVIINYRNKIYTATQTHADSTNPDQSTFWKFMGNEDDIIGNTFVTYDDEQSCKLKAEYVLKKEAAGVIIWDMTGDYMERGGEGSGSIKNTPLVDALYDVLQPCRRKPIKKRWRSY